ncbi:amino acid ABC transporter membrane protein (PAAT family) [Alicyclobacillus sacchari]|uniref:Amino acid ABC transporter membrane protein (PAAT family) n=1 Tax=Alicyclobacillus sacchari TaxID=392010 RepID=A0A4R8LRF7_9BACL|nr:amino acid ABC transporter permease [Alicyclobacillus sacchari]TDY50170.1 amino acid ABC transporter membrane protein (PAAT family) [Alicyclobacillus sacchari]
MNFFQFLSKYAGTFAQGALVTVELTLCGLIIGLILGVLVSLMNLSHIWPFRWFARLYTWVVRGTPLLVQLFIVYYGLPQVGLQLTPFLSAIIALGLNSAGYVAEIIRAGIQSIDPGQMEAAESLGMRYGQAMRRIIFPQAYRRLLPPIVNEFVALLKDSSLVSTISMTELMRIGQTVSSSTFMPMQSYITAALFYLAMTSIIVFFSGKLERWLEVRG